MSVIKKASAYANNAVAYVAWRAPNLPADCLGFEITRIAADGSERILASWVPFEGQSNPDWRPQDTSVWPVQKFTWRDLTVRQRRDQAELRDQATYTYRIRPVGKPKAGRTPIATTLTKTYDGETVALAYIDEGRVTEPVTVTSNHKPLTVAFNNGILSTQWLSHAMQSTLGRPVNKADLKDEIAKSSSQIRTYLGGDLPSLFKDMFGRLADGGTLYLALYELTDPVLFDLILQNAGRVRLILSNTGLDKETGLWDTENAPFRDKLHGAGLVEMQDRFFNNSQHIGHNKFMVYVDGDGHARAVLSGSANWTPNGLCAQSNNAFIAELPELAEQFLGYWNDLKRDTEAFDTPAGKGAPTRNAQGTDLRMANAQGLPVVNLGVNPVSDGAIRLWRSPNTRQKNKPSKNPAIPPDLNEVFWYIEHAQRAVFFAVFLPSDKGANSVISATVAAAGKNPDLTVYGVISSPMAMPNAQSNTESEGNADEQKKFQPTLFEQGKVHIVRANSLNGADMVGSFEKELLSAGNAIIHDKIVVIDPIVQNGCIVVTGSHNLGFKASYANDDNLVIVRNQLGIAHSYMVHVLDLYEHYRFRAIQAERQQSGKTLWNGFIRADGKWQDKYPQGVSDLASYLV